MVLGVIYLIGLYVIGRQRITAVGLVYVDGEPASSRKVAA
jgi:hypothetical protein